MCSAAGVVEGLLLLQRLMFSSSASNLPGKGERLFSHSSFSAVMGVIDLVDPLLDVESDIRPPCSTSADPLQHGLPGQFQELIVHLFLRLVPAPA